MNSPTPEDIAEVDALDNPRRAALSFVVLQTIAGRAARAGFAARAEDALAAVTAHARGMEPGDPCTATLDGWARLGAVQGTLDGWAGTGVSMPSVKAAPSPQHMGLYMAAASFAWGVVQGVRHGR